MTVPDPGQITVNQADYITTLEDEVAREAKARRVLTTLLAQRTRTLQTYVDRYGDITAGAGAAGGPVSDPSQEGSDGAAATAG